LIVALLVCLAVIVGIYVVTDWDLFDRILSSIAGTYLIIGLLDRRMELKSWRRKKLCLKSWDERRKADS
jgi:hypothetical protein